ncbi:MAG: molecular chaperone [Alphaproteobacteria bacterium]|jgi:fimbrial chaperone protein|nr:molecular chaperone [Alphaproteobacteria bacterium]MBT5390027.1 molecular chaperone [Alphaproteobacteria bacterium]MBT5540906.1 molecular chaperone [Alphaproteobacteria bacterium]MBT5654206.1 molecular chaperone [Alphaproteobacteria bacterium]
MKHKNKILLAFFSCLLLSNPSKVFATGSYHLNPIRLHLSPQDTVTKLLLRNLNDESGQLQVQLKSWDQKDGEDLYELSRDMVVSPPIFPVKGKKSQTIRVALRNAPDEKREKAYRLFITEIIPEVTTAAQAKARQGKLQVQLVMSIPVFVHPKNETEMKPIWKAKRLDSKTVQVDLHNAGENHIRVADLQLKDTADKPISKKESTFSYVLPEQRHTWKISLDKDLTGNEIKLTGLLKEDEYTTTITVE